MAPTGERGAKRAPRRSTRAGGWLLRVLSDELIAASVRALAAGPLKAPEFAECVGGAARNTRFVRLRRLERIGALARERLPGRPPGARYRLTDAGRHLLPVAGVLDAWLGRCPLGPLELGSTAAAVAIRALTAGWGSTILRQLADAPRSLTELDRLIEDASYPELERALRTLAKAGQVRRVAGAGRRRPYTLTPWVGEAVAPLAEAVRWERAHAPELAAPVTSSDAETGLLMATSLVELPGNTDGACSLVVDAVPQRGGSFIGGVRVTVAAGRIVSCLPDGQPEPSSCVRGSVPDWLAAVIDGRPNALEMRGDTGLPTALLAGMHEALYWAED